MNPAGHQSYLSTAALDRKRDGLELAFAAQQSRVRSRRLRRAAVLGAGTLGALALAAVLMRGTPAPVQQPGPIAHTPTKPAPTAPAAPVITFVRDDPGALAAVRIDDGELRSLLAEAGEPVGLVRVQGRVISEREILLAVAETPGATTP